MRAFDLARAWPAPDTSLCVIDNKNGIHKFGDTARQSRIASVSKLLTAWATHIAIEEGATSLSAEVGQAGCTVGHLLAHAGGYSFSGDVAVVSPERKRIYSNTGYDLVANHVQDTTEIEFAEYLNEAVFAPLGMTSSSLKGSGAKDIFSCVDDLMKFVYELRVPQLLAPTTAALVVTNQFGDLEGVIPGVGRFDPCNWGYGPEIHGTKQQHWMGSRNSAATYGHFGGTGTFLWHDPVVNVSCVGICEIEFDEWALNLWPIFFDAVLDELAT